MTSDSAGKAGTGMGRQLLQVARSSLTSFVRDARPYRPNLESLPGALKERGSTFVTLTNRGLLRGCIGSTEFRHPLAVDVAQNAAAASRDPRFSPVTAAELADVRLEVTLLQPPQPLEYKNEDELFLKLRPGVDGVIVQWEEQRGLLLPQVWARLPQAADFMRALCQKAQIPADVLQATPPTVRVFTFRAHAFEEDGYRIKD